MDDALPLLEADDHCSNDIDRPYDPTRKHFFDSTWNRNSIAWRTVLFSGLWLLLWLSTAIIFSALWHHYDSAHCINISASTAASVFSPARSAVEYIVRTFQQNITEVPAAFRNPRTVDSAWDDLYNAGFRSTISKDEAMHIPNETTWWVNGKAVVTLSVFHELHCLDLIRHALEPHYSLKAAAAATMSGSDDASKHGSFQPAEPMQPTRYADLQMVDLIDHLNHCIHSLRQAVSCSSDISVGVWQWDEDLSDYKPNFGTEHTCRNFEKIQDWARSRSLHNVK